MSGTEPSYVLRQASESDFEWLRRLHHASMRESIERIWGWDEDRQDAFFRKHFDPSRIQIIQAHGRDIGAIEVERRSDAIFLADIQVDPVEQGRGVGSSLIRELQQEAVARGVKLLLQVNRANRARTLYERLEFLITGETQTHYQMCWLPPQPAPS